jgi:small GTP-binding protein
LLSTFDSKVSENFVGVGKSCLSMRYVKDIFTPQFINTIGVDFRSKNIELDGKCIKVQVCYVEIYCELLLTNSKIWDTAGQERFFSITASYFRGSHGILFVYDVTNRNSFLAIRNWFTLSQQVRIYVSHR